MTSTADRLIAQAQQLLQANPSDTEYPLEDWSPLERSTFARNLASVASVLQAQEQLKLARKSRRIQRAQLELQRTVGFPGLVGAVELAERIAATEPGKWDAGTVNDWIAAAQALNTP